ncbi:MAG: hypothetical protein Q9178_003559 [Gyalolechia marmorata]
MVSNGQTPSDESQGAVSASPGTSSQDGRWNKFSQNGASSPTASATTDVPNSSNPAEQYQVPTPINLSADELNPVTDELDPCTENTGQPNPAPCLRLDTAHVARQKFYTGDEDRRRSALGGRSDTQGTDVSPEKPCHAPSSPRTRERGFSLRRSLLTRNIHGEPESSSSYNELDVTGSSKKSRTTIAISPPVRREPNQDTLSSRPLKSSTSLSALPHYETWLRGRVAKSSLLSSLQIAYRKAHKTILRIQELPPTKDGRHVAINTRAKKGLVDERTNREYVDNTIRSCKYTAWNFLPRQLYAQFSKLANFYFLCVSILQMIPGLSTTGTYTTIIPLCFFVMLSMAKEGYDDFRRFKLDKAENNRSTVVLRTEDPPSEAREKTTGSVSTVRSLGRWETIKWKDVRVGDVVKLVRDEAAPADLVVLHANGMNDVAYVETMALDGETNLKSKAAPPPVAKACSTIDNLSHCEANYVVEDPNLDLYKFEGRVNISDENLPLTNNEIIYRGSVIRNTPEVLSMVIYTGEECKIRMNATKNPRIKAPSLQAAVNKVVVITVLFVLALAIFNTVAYQIWRDSTEEKSWYLVDASVGFFPILASFIILFNTMIPLSLYVSLEIVKLFQMILMNDIEMYDEDSNTPMEARTSTINEELGQISYIFSDKTGTLTNNSMRFRKMSVAGTAWLHDFDLSPTNSIASTSLTTTIPQSVSKGKGPMRRGTLPSIVPPSPKTGDPPTVDTPSSAISRNGSMGSAWKSSAKPSGPPSEMRTAVLVRYIQSRPHTMFAKKARFFLLSLALCHTCLPERNEQQGIEYQAASPDEIALVRGAQELGYIVIDRQAKTITIKSHVIGKPDLEPRLDIYNILDVIEFSSLRKRMSIIVRMPDQRICVFCKGADTTIIKLLRLASLAEDQALKVQRRVSKRQSLEAQQAIRRDSEQRARKDSMTRTSISIHRSSIAVQRLRPIQDELDDWLNEREQNIEGSTKDQDSVYYSPRPSAHYGIKSPHTSFDGRNSLQGDETENLVEEALVANDAAVFERCFQHINDFATEGLRTLLYGYRYLDDDEYEGWKKLYLDASTSLVDRQEKVENVGSMVERDLELAGATAIEDKLQEGVPETIEKLRRAGIHIFMLTGDKIQTAINVGHSARMIKDYSSITILDHDSDMDMISQRIAATTIEINRGQVAHSVVVIDGQTLGRVEADDVVKQLFFELAALVDTLICARASPANKASLVHAVRKKVKHAITLAIGDGANDIAMIQEAHVGIGITGKEGLQAARTSDYSIAQFRFLLRLLLVHGRWNYIRTCKYTLGTFWKEFLFYLTQALYQRWVGYTGTSLYESASLSMFNTLFTSLPVIFVGIFEKDLSATTLLAAPELYSFGHRNAGFSIRIYAGWIFMASSEAMVVYFLMLGLYGKAVFTLDNGLYAMGVLTFTACIVIIATKMQFTEVHNKSITCAIAMFLSIGGWFAWNLVLSSMYSDNVIYNVRDGFLDRFGRNALWWLTLILIVLSCCGLEISMKALKVAFMPEDEDVFRELEKDAGARERLERAAAVGLKDHISDSTSTGEGIQRVQTHEEQEKREGEVQELLDQPRVMVEHSGVRKRQVSADLAQDIELADVHGADQFKDDDDNSKSKEISSPVQEMLRIRFGHIRRSLDHLVPASMLCAISGEAPQVPVASRKSGNVFEKRLIEAYITENGRDPVTDEELSSDDLVELKTARIVRPRPPTLTSIPSLLSVFQNEWDALALETYTLRQQLIQTRQELSTALYQHDAAVRVIARLSRERDEAREALSGISVHKGLATNGDAMQVDRPGLSDELIANIEATQARLSKTRRKRPVPADWVTADALNSFTSIDKFNTPYTNGRSLAVNAPCDALLLGSSDGKIGVYSITEKAITEELDAGPAQITDTLWLGAKAVASTSTGNVKIFESGLEVAGFSGHAGEVTALASHPCGDILASVGIDKSYIFYDLTSNTVATQVFTDAVLTAAGFHPDGHLFAAGGADGQIKMFDVKTATNAANFESTGSIEAISFSENGTWLASAAKGSTSVSVWDLRKAAVIHTIEIGSSILALEWEYTGQFLAIAGPSGLVVQQYSKSSKEWSEPLKSAVPSLAVGWGLNASSMYCLDAEGLLTTLLPQ